MDDLIPPLSYAPDGLHESDIDALLVEYFGPDHELVVIDAAAPAWADRVAAHRHSRRVGRQAINAALRSVQSGSAEKHTDTAA
jgi:hypothetical protein